MKTGNLKCGKLGSRMSPSAKQGGKLGNLPEPMVGSQGHKAKGSIGSNKTYSSSYSKGSAPGTVKHK